MKKVYNRQILITVQSDFGFLGNISQKNVTKAQKIDIYYMDQ